MNIVKDIILSLGKDKVDLLLKNGRLVNVLSGEVVLTHLAIAQGRIIGFGNYPAKKTINLKGLYLAPGLIDGHIHLESSMVTPLEFARTVLPLGTTSVISDPHEIANVLGISGIKYILQANEFSPLAISVMLPSCVPATPLETSGWQLEAKDLKPLLKHPQVLGLAEVMNFPGVIFRDKRLLAKIQMAKGKVIDGHAPGLSGKSLYAYINAGIKSDHECVSASEAREKLRSGMFIMIREGTAARNLQKLLKVVTPENSRRCMFVADDRNPPDLINQGHINYIIKKAIRLGLNPIIALQMATLNPARYFGLNHLGALAPGYQADIIAFDNFRNFNIKIVWKSGHLVAQNGKPQCTIRNLQSAIRNLKSTIHLKSLHPDSFRIPAKSKSPLRQPAEEAGYIRVIELVPHQIITRHRILPAKISAGEVVVDLVRDILKIAVVERHKATGNIGLGFIKGFGLKRGALGSSVAHDSHNIILVGTNDRDILLVLQTIQRVGGGQVIVADGKVLESLPLPIGGIISDKPITQVARKIRHFNTSARQLGCKIPDPFMTLSFLALAPIPALKLTDKGLVDVNQFKLVSLFTRKA